MGLGIAAEGDGAEHRGLVASMRAVDADSAAQPGSLQKPSVRQDRIEREVS